jgi:HSP20 family molecular chaperone IbpA
MAAMHTMGLSPVLPPDATVTKATDEYVVSLPVTGFAREELEVEIADHVLTVRGDQMHSPTDGGRTFTLHEKIEESFLLPPDVDSGRVTVVYAHRKLEIHAPRISTETTPRRVPIARPPTHSVDAASV